MLIVDGREGVLIVNPDRQVFTEYQLKSRGIEIERQKLKRLRTTHAATLDGITIDLQAATVTCPAGRVLLGGGANIDLNGGTPQWGVHLRGTYPSDAAGHPATNGKSADSWTSAVEDGGQAAPGTSSTAFAVCSA